MRQPAKIVVREYDKLGKENKYAEYYQKQNNYKIISSPHFDELKKFITDFQFQNANDENIFNYFNVSYRPNGETITIKNYVGLIELKNGYQIEILPKANLTESEARQIVLKMLQSLFNFKSKSFNMAKLDVADLDIFEVFIRMYLNETLDLVKQGLKFAYVKNEDNLSVLKGKINIKKQILKNHYHQEKIYCTYFKYQINRPENRLIKTTLLELNKITNSFENKKIINLLLSSFAQVDVSYNIDGDFSKININRTNKNYSHILEWSKIFLKQKSFSAFSGSTVSKTLLFAMEKLFESYVAKNMKKVFKEDIWRVKIQDYKNYLFDLPKKFRLKPDIVLYNAENVPIILDTKWKKLTKIEDVSEADLYQMYAYAKKYNAQNVWLLYPLDNDSPKTSLPVLKSRSNGDNVTINFFFVDLKNISASLETLKAKIMDKSSELC